jgi:glucose-1-phosphate thymidylyltransferase
MVYIAGKPIIGHILDRMIDLGPEEIILVVGYYKDQLMSYVSEHYHEKFNIRYVEQEKRLGLGHSVYITREYVEGSDVMIALGDMIFKTGYIDFYKKHADNKKCAGSIGVKEVDEPRKYGIVEIEHTSSCIRKLEEKPERPTSNLGIAGVYFIKDTKILFNILEQMINSGKTTRGEYQLTDALQEMIQSGLKLKTFEVSSWYDCGLARSLLETYQVLLNEKEDIDRTYENENSMIIHPVAIGKNVKIINSVVGPHTSIAEGTIIRTPLYRTVLSAQEQKYQI